MWFKGPFKMLKFQEIHSENKHPALCCGRMPRASLSGIPCTRVLDIVSSGQV